MTNSTFNEGDRLELRIKVEEYFSGRLDPSNEEQTTLSVRAIGFSDRGKFQVHKERAPEGKTVWERYYAKGCPELLEYITRYALIKGGTTGQAEHYIENIERGTLYHNEAAISVWDKIKKPNLDNESEFYTWAKAHLPDWQELYTPDGLNFVAVFLLIHLAKKSDLPYPDVPAQTAAYLCRKIASPYKIRFCQGVPSKAGTNDNWPELYQSELVLLCGESILKDPYTAPLEVPVLRPTCPLVDLISDLEAELAEAEREAALAKLMEGLSFLLPADSAGNVELPESMAGIQAMQANIDKAMELHNQLAAYKPTTKEWI